MSGKLNYLGPRSEKACVGDMVLKQEISLPELLFIFSVLHKAV